MPRALFPTSHERRIRSRQRVNGCGPCTNSVWTFTIPVSGYVFDYANLLSAQVMLAVSPSGSRKLCADYECCNYLLGFREYRPDAHEPFMHEFRVNFLNARFRNRRPITRTFSSAQPDQKNWIRHRARVRATRWLCPPCGLPTAPASTLPRDGKLTEYFSQNHGGGVFRGTARRHASAAKKPRLVA
jgi:hypothetical protein